ncbi:hypothetical protein D3C72_2096420 [compost metagenome]
MVTVRNLYHSGCSAGLSSFSGNGFNPLNKHRFILFTEITHCTQHLYFFGYDIRTYTTINCTYSYYTWIFGYI